MRNSIRVVLSQLDQPPFDMRQVGLVGKFDRMALLNPLLGTHVCRMALVAHP